MSWLFNGSTGGGGTGTVTSVGLGADSGAILVVSGSPVTTSGTLQLQFNNEAANTVFAGPTTGAAATPTFRALVAADLPAGTGTVTSFSAGNLSPLFTTSVATSTTTPALSFSLSNAAQNAFLAGPSTGGAGAPAYRAIVFADLPAIPTGTILWNQIGNPNGSLTLTTGSNTTTFNSTSSIANQWLWAATAAATGGTSYSSPTLNLQAQYWTGAASAADTWSIYSSLGAGTNAISTLILSHAGSTGNSYLQLPSIALQFTATPADIDFQSNTSWTLNFTNSNGGTTNGSISGAAGSFTVQSNNKLILRVASAGNSTDIFGEITTTLTTPSVIIENSGNYTGTSGTQRGLGIGFNSSANGFTFAPTTGTAKFVACEIDLTVNQTGSSSGSYTGLSIVATETSLKGTANKLIDCLAGSAGTSEVFYLDNSGDIFQLNPTVATVSTTNASPTLNLVANYWTGAASAADTWTLQSSLLAGTNGTSTLTISHAGSTGAAQIVIPTGAVSNPGLAGAGNVTSGFVLAASTYYSSGGAYSLGFLSTGLILGSGKVSGWSSNTNPAAAGADTAISRISAGTLGIGTGAAASTAGNLQLNQITKYNGNATVSAGVPSELATSDLTGQVAAITATTLLSAPATGMYRISWSADITTASDGTSVLGGSNGFQVLYTSPTDSVVKTTVSGNSVTSAANTTGTAIGGTQTVYAKAATNVQFTFGYTSVQTTTAMAFEIHIKVESL